MNIWSAEIKELNQIYQSVKGKHSKLEKELQSLIKTDDANILLVYSRRCLEVIITDICEIELKRHRGTEPLQRIIDKLNKEEIVPHNIIVSMQNVNSMSTFGAHPKEFEAEQVKPVLINLKTILEWYLKYTQNHKLNFKGAGTLEEERKKHAGLIRSRSNPRKRIIIVTVIMMIAVIIISSFFVFKIIGNGKLANARSIKSLVILPFKNLTGDNTFENAISGMHICLIDDIGRLSGLQVTNSTTASVYKNAGMSIQEIAKKLNVDAAMEVSVLGILDSLIIKVNLISAFPEEESIWNEDYTESKNQILNLYNRITKQIASEVKVELTPGEKKLLEKARVVNPDALFAYMKGQYYWERLGKEDLDSAYHYFQIAIEEDPDWADPYAGVAITWSTRGGFAYAPLTESNEKAYEYLNKALKLDPNSANSHYVKALVSVWPGWDWETGEKEFKKTLELQPNHALCRIYYSNFLAILNRFDEAKYQADLALRLDPEQSLVLALYAMTMIMLEDPQSALEQSKKAVSVDPDNSFALAILANSYLVTGDTIKWFEMITKLSPDKEYVSHLDTVFQKGGYLAVIKDRIKVEEEIYNKGGVIDLSDLASNYVIIGNYDKAMDYYEKAYEEKSWGVAYISFHIKCCPEMGDNPRYISLLKKLNLPLPKTD